MQDNGNKVPNAALKKVVDNPKLLHQVEPLRARVNCPSCKIGYMFVRVEKHGYGKQQEIKVPEIDHPHKCEVCGKWHGLKMQLKITAFPKVN